MSILRSLDLVAALVFGLVAGAWVDRLRRRPVLIWADLGRAVLLGSIPVAFAFGVLTFPHLLVVTGLAAVLTVFFDSADNAYLPTIVEREQLTDANAALSASGSASEFLAFGLGGFLVQLLSAPVTIAIDAVTFLVSAVLLGTIRKAEPPPPPPAERARVLDEIRDGVRLVRHDPILRAFARLADLHLPGLGHLRDDLVALHGRRAGSRAGGPWGGRGRRRAVLASSVPWSRDRRRGGGGSGRS